MSFVGLLFSKEGIIGFGDSKTSVSNATGLEEDYQRGHIQKVFTSSKFIVATHGFNQVITSDNKILNIEDIIYSATHMNNTIDELIEYLKNTIQDKDITINKSFCFYIGYQHPIHKYAIVRCQINTSSNIPKVSDEVYPTENGYTLCYGGDKHYVDMMNAITIDRALPINKMKDVIRDIMEHMMAIYEKTLTYNPVGGPIQIEIFQ